MTDPTNDSVPTPSLAPIARASTERSSETSPEDALAFFEMQTEEFRRIKKMYRFLRKVDQLDTAIANAIESFLESPLELSVNLFSLSDVADIVHGFPIVQSLLTPNFFLRVTLPFRLLRRCLNLHLVNPVTEEMTSSVHLPADEREDPHLREQIWFLQFLGSSANGVAETLERFRDNRTRTTN